jgi:hypothetical protein
VFDTLPLRSRINWQGGTAVHAGGWPENIFNMLNFIEKGWLLGHHARRLQRLSVFRKMQA